MTEPLDRFALARLVEEARAERDRYREALETVASSVSPLEWVHGVAMRALHGDDWVNPYD